MPSEPAVKRVVAFVDGQNLFYGVKALRDIANIRRAIFTLLREQYGEIDRELREIDQLVRARG